MSDDAVPMDEDMPQSKEAQDAMAKLDAAEEMEAKDVKNAIDLYKALIHSDQSSEDVYKVQEQAIYKLGALYSKQGMAAELGALLKSIRPFFGSIAKAKTAKIVRTVIELLAKIPNTVQQQIDLCLESIEWTISEKRTFLRQRIQAKLAALYLEIKDYQAAIKVLDVLIKEVKKLDDKLLLVEIQLTESRVYFALANVPKAKASLTNARTSANAIYTPPLLQANIDMQAGTVHAEEKDYKTAYSYFFEAFEGFNGTEDNNAVLCLKYMLLCKIMTNSADDVHSIINGKSAIRHAGVDIAAMKAVASAHSKRSLEQFEEVQSKYKEQLKGDPIINSHLSALYDNLLEQNLSRLIEPFSHVEISHVAELIKLPMHIVETKLSQMILDKKFKGILDQGAGCLISFDDVPSEKTYPAALNTISHMGSVVDSLFQRASKI
jgi:26S proteasome regulatory subunit N6